MEFRGKLAFLLLAGGAGAPVDHFGFVDLEAMVRMGLEAGGFADGATDVFGLAAGTADEVVMIVADAVFITRRGIGGLDASDDAVVGEDAQDIIDRLTRDRADVLADAFGQGVGSGVRMTRDGPEDGQALGRDGQVVLAKGGFRVAHLTTNKNEFWTLSKRMTSSPNRLQEGVIWPSWT